LGGSQVDVQLEHLLNNGRVKLGNIGTVYVLTARNPYDTTKVMNNIHFVPSEALRALVGREDTEDHDGKKRSSRKQQSH
jgi:hypothetical protein